MVVVKDTDLMMTKNFRLLIVEYTDYNNFPLGGQTTFISNMIKSLSCSVDLVGLNNSGKSVGRWTTRELYGKMFSFFPIFNTGPTPGNIPARIWFLYLLLRYKTRILKNQYDAILLQSPEAAFPFLYSRHKPALILCMAGATNPMKAAKYALARNNSMAMLYDRIFVDPLIRKSSAVIGINEECRQKVNSLGKCYMDKMIHSSVAVDLSVFFFPTQKDIIRNQLGIDLSAAVVIFAGRLENVKGLDLLIKAFVKFRESIKRRALLYLCGDGTQKGSLQTLALQLGIEKNVRFSGMVPHTLLRDYFQCSDIFSMTSYYEGLPNVMLEAMACGLPVVSTEVGGIADLVKNNYTGFITKKRDPEYFAVLLEKAYTDRKRLGKNAADFVHDNYSSDKVIRKIEDKFFSLVTNK